MGQCLDLKRQLLCKKVEECLYTHEEIYSGLCTEVFYDRLRWGAREVEMLLMDSILQRAGIDTEKYENIVSRMEYEIIYTLDLIVESIDNASKDVYEYIRKYEELTKGYPIVYLQLKGLLEAMCMLYIDKESVKAEEKLLNTMKMTIADYNMDSNAIRPFSYIEFVIHTLLIHILVSENRQINVEKEMSLAGYMQNRYEGIGFVRVFAYYAYYVGKAAIRQGKQADAHAISSKAILYLKKSKRLYNVRNLLDIWTRTAEACEERNTALWIKAQYEAMYAEFGAEKESVSWCIPYASNEVYSIDEVVKIRRKAVGLKQEELAEGICTNRTISNIEQGRYNPKPTKRAKILSRLGINSMCYGEVETADYDIYKEVVKLSRYINDYKWKESRELFAAIKKRLPDTTVNRQYIMFHEYVIDSIRGNKNRENVNYISDLIAAIEKTCKVWQKDVQWIYSVMETNILLNIANVHIKNGRHEDGIAIFKKVTNFYEEQKLGIRHFVSPWSMMNYMLGSYLGNGTDVEVALAVTKKYIDKELSHGGSALMAKKMYDIGWDIEKMENEKGIPYRDGMPYMKYSYALGLLINERAIEIVNNNVKKKYGITKIL